MQLTDQVPNHHVHTSSQTSTSHHSSAERWSPVVPRLTPDQLAVRINVPKTWVLDNAKSFASDPIPCLSLGKFKRFIWGSPDLNAWIERHIVSDDPIPVSDVAQASDYEYLDSADLAKRLNISESWVRDQVRPRALDPVPYVRFGKYIRFRWLGPELEFWLNRRMLFTRNRTVTRAEGKEVLQ